MTIKYYNKSTKYNTKYNNLKRVLIKRLTQGAKIAGYTVLAGLSYIVLVGLTV